MNKSILFLVLFSVSFNFLFAEASNPDSLVVNCPADVLEYTEPFSCAKIVNYNMPVIDNSCGPYEMNLIEGKASGEVFPPGTTIVRYNINDSVGNEEECLFNVFVLDSVSPLVEVVEPITLYLSPSCDAMIPDVTLNMSITDNCALFNIEQDIAVGTTISETTMVNVLVEDLFGNSVNKLVEVQVIDSVIPEINCVTDYVFSADSNCEFNDTMFEVEIIVNDDCALNLNTGSYFEFPYALGSHSVTSYAIDGSGNEANCDVQISIEDNTDPVAICPGDKIIQPTADCMAVLPNYAEELIVSDNCSNTLNIDQTPAPGSFIDMSTIITLEVTDAAGNTSQCAFIASPDEVDNGISQEMNILSANLDNAMYQWFDCSGAKPLAISGEVAQEFEATETGSYAVQVTVGSCSVMSDCVNVNISNNTEIQELREITVFPNPSNGLFTIDFTNEADFPIFIEVKDVLGRVVKTKVVKTAAANKIDLTNLSDGQYSLRAISAKNNYQTILIKQ